MSEIGPELVIVLALAGCLAFIAGALRPSWRIWMGGYVLMLLALSAAYVSRGRG